MVSYYVEQLVSSKQMVYLQAPVVDPITTVVAEFYLIQYQEMGNQGSGTTTSLNYTLLELDKGTEYMLTVAGVNEAGVGIASEFGPVETAVDGEQLLHINNLIVTTVSSPQLSHIFHCHITHPLLIGHRLERASRLWRYVVSC